jgi:hypothetical protein
VIVKKVGLIENVINNNKKFNMHAAISHIRVTEKINEKHSKHQRK